MSGAANVRSRAAELLRRLLPATLRNRVILFMLLGVLSSQLLVLAVWTLQARNQAREEVQQTAAELAAAAAQSVRFFKSLPVQYRPLLIDQLRTTGGARFFLQLNRSRVEQGGPARSALARDMSAEVERLMGADLAAHGMAGVHAHFAQASTLTVTDDGQPLTALPEHWLQAAGLAQTGQQPLLAVQAELDPGNWLLLVTPLPNPGLFEKANPYAPDRLLLVLAGLAALLLVVMLVAREITRSLSRLGQAASSFARDMAVEPIPETGPQEVRGLAHAFNEMQSRIGRAVEDREHLFRSVSHDLQTPIMRLKFRAEMLDDTEAREGFNADLQELSDLLKGALTTMRGADLSEATVEIALDDLLRALTGVGMAAGAQLTLRADPVRIWGKPLAIKRALGNLIDNALRYGIRVEIDVHRRGEFAVVTIRDHGPGLPEDALQRMFEPYLRLDHGMKTHSQGNGLGLWIARNAVRRHGGDIVLRNHPEGGLEAEVTLKGLTD
ncbi:ATP-binding protein [Hydrogenophaga sp. RWCD_12]|uniref:ATP-binding protein n=1 Tax=Hydrogenophaga sp. RWCD_12 TaxID=3391190 RepID=UPI00398491BF